jgi:ferredoxin
MLKKARVIISIASCALLTFYFVDFAGIAPPALGWLARVQLLPALASGSAIVIVAAWLLLTILAGRVYCSSVCPLGILQDAIAWIARRVGKRKRYRYRPPRPRLRWAALLLPLLLFYLGYPFLLGLVEPYSAYGRVTTALSRPLYLAGNNLMETILSSFNIHAFYRVGIFIHDLFSFCIALLTLAIIGALAWRRGRTWCNTLCPVGALLGFLAKYALFKIRLDAGKCTRCGACAAKCKSGCINSKEKRVDNSRCVACFNCLDACRVHALGFTAARAAPAPRSASRRRFLLASATLPAALATASSWRLAGTGSRKPTPVAPPGAISHEHLSRHCTSCHLCISKCPSRVLKPAFMEYGLAGMMQPVARYNRGFCNYNCTVCGEVCPNGAILPLTTEQKQMTSIGRVVFVEELCIVISNGTSCGACSEHCPTQAVTMVPRAGGLTSPRVDASICVGCGGCEYICPVRPARAIYVEGNPVHAPRAAFKEEQQQEIIIDDFGF